MQTSLKTMLMGSSTSPRIATSVMLMKRKAHEERVTNKPQQFAHFPLQPSRKMPTMLSGIVTIMSEKKMVPTIRLEPRSSANTPIKPLYVLLLDNNGIYGE